jgi:hypothetical protein
MSDAITMFAGSMPEFYQHYTVATPCPSVETPV